MPDSNINFTGPIRSIASRAHVPRFASLLPPAAATGTTRQPGLTSTTFLAQCKSALKTLANAVALPHMANSRPTATQNERPLLSPLSNAPIAPVHDQAVDASMPTLLAELGFAVVPTAFVTPPPAIDGKP